MTDDRVHDTFGRPLRSLRISVTDRCNLRCHYCMPEEKYVWLPRASLLSFEEIDRLAGIFAGLGVNKVRITGGEPLLRHDLPDLVRLLGAGDRFTDLALTTNGLLLSRAATALRAAGLGRISLSLDTLQPERFARYARSAKLEQVLDGLAAARAVGFSGTKINTVVTRGDNDDEVVALFEFASGQAAQIRYIEYMDVGGATAWRMDKVVSREEILERMRQNFGTVVPLVRDTDPSAPAEVFALADGRTFGIVSSTTAPFCAACDRARLTADGTFFTCLYSDDGIDLRAPLRSGRSDDEIAGLIAGVWGRRRDRGAEERLGAPDRGALYQISGLRAKPHREMHTRGG